jgi:toxin-antitoxin system PIN domain toxin
LILIDVNVLLYAHKRQSKDHARYREWLEDVIRGEEPYAIAELVLSGFVRIATHPKIFDRPSTLDEALAFVEVLRDQPNSVLVAPGERHWSLFQGLCRKVKARGNLIADAYLAALAIESGCEWITTDRDFSRFPGLRWRLPF